jgi:hypothetical protein
MFAAGLIALVCGSVLGYVHFRHRRRLAAERGTLFDECRHALGGVASRQEGFGYPVLEGRYRGLPVRLEAVVDHLSLRKLPQLLTLITLRAPLASSGIVDLLARPQNTEFYSPWSELPYCVESKPHWPAQVVVRSNQFGELPVLRLLDPYMRMFEDDPRLKELLITPRGLRLVYLLDEGERGPYLLFRKAVFGAVRLDAAVATRLLQTLVALHAALGQPVEPGRSTGPETCEGDSVVVR